MDYILEKTPIIQKSMTMDSNMKRFRIGKSAFVYAGFVVLGLAMSLGGPSVPDMCERMAVTAEELSIAFSVQSIMWTVGAIIMGPIIDRLQNHVDLFLSIGLIVMGVSCLVKPFSSYLWVFITASAIESLGYATIDLSSNALMFSTWGEKANSPVQGLHMSWGIGFAFGPLIIRPFLGPDPEDDMGNITSTISPTISILDEIEVQESRIEIAYAITSVLALAMGLGAFIMYRSGVPDGVTLYLKPKSSFKEVFSLKSYAAGDRNFAILMLTLFALFYFANSGREGVFSTWLFNYAIESELDFTKQEAALLDAAAKFSFLGGRLIATVLAIVVPIQPMIFVEIYSVMAIVLGLAAYGTQEKVYLWVFSCLLNAFSAPIWPGGLTWTDRYIVVSGIAFTIMNLGAGSAGLFFHWFTGYLFTNKSADAIMYVLIFCSAMLCVMIIIMQVVASRHGSRFTAVAMPEATKKAMEKGVDTWNASHACDTDLNGGKPHRMSESGEMSGFKEEWSYL